MDQSSITKMKDTTDVAKYLNKFEVEDLGHIIRDRRSTKKLNSPLIGGQKSQTGQIRKGNSVPAKVFQDKDYEHGVSSYFKGHHMNLGDVLSN
jgi:hypothetical protein